MYYKVPPVEWKSFDELIKKAIFTRWSSGGTTMTLPMQYAIDNPKQFHFTFTDGRVFDSRLTPESLKNTWMKKLKGRIHFFLAAKKRLVIAFLSTIALSAVLGGALVFMAMFIINFIKIVSSCP